jgi:osmotically-inducible protein OsmY
MPPAQTKQDILRRVRAALQSEPRLGSGYRPERLEIGDDGALIIEGEVPDIAAKKLALECIAALEPITAIVDRLHVEPAARMGDAEIRAHLRRTFSQEPAFSGLMVRQMHHESFEPVYQPVYEVVAGGAPDTRGHIDIEVREGVVTLNGQVPGLNSKRLAGVLAWWVPGVRDVINGLAVEPPEEDAPIRIEEAVRTVLERNPFIDAAQIRVGVRHRDVRLTGVMPSADLRAMAERDAWCVFGVDNVINEIEVSA